MAYYSKIELTENNFLFCEELKVKHLKTIYKCLLSDEVETRQLFYNLNQILSEISDSKLLKKINFLDYFILLLEIRCSSISNIINVQIAENTTYEINLFKIIEKIKNINFKEQIISDTFEKVTFNYKIPNIEDIIIFNEQPENIHNFFIKSIDINGSLFEINDFDKTNQILEKIPARYFSIVIKKISNIINFFNSINLLDYNTKLTDTNTALYFNFNIKNLLILIKLLFGGNLMSLYDNIMILCKLNHFTPEYIENCTPGEYLLYMKKLEEMNSKSPQNENNSNFPEEAINEESFNPYENDDLPPITSEFTG